jgi:hypothetical protein
VFSPAWFWGRMRRGGITAMVASPTTLSGLKEALDLIERSIRLSARRTGMSRFGD